MKAIFIILIYLGRLSVCVYGQNFTHPNKTQQPKFETKNDYTQKSIYTVIDSAVNDSVEIVGLGEPSHGDVTSFNFQMGMLKHLTAKFDFRELLVESDQNIIDTLMQYFNSNDHNPDSVINFMHKVIPPNDVSNNTKEAIELFTWIKDFNIAHKDNPLIVKGIGFDNKDPKAIFYKYMLPFDSLNAVKLKRRWKSKPTLVIDVWADIFRWFSTNHKRLKLHMSPGAADSLENDIEYMKVVYTTYYRPENDMSIQKLSSREKINKFEKGQAVRDSAMASNVIKYLENSKNRKAILWAHNMHIQAWRPYRLPIDRKEAPSMGLILKNRFGNRYLTIGEDFSDSATFVGSPEYNTPGASKYQLTIKTLETSERSKASANLLRKKFRITSGIYTWQALKNIGLDNYIFQNIYVQGVRFYVEAIPDVVVIFKNLLPRTVL